MLEEKTFIKVEGLKLRHPDNVSVVGIFSGFRVWSKAPLNSINHLIVRIEYLV